MFDVGWMELLLIGVVALIVVGPKELPGMFRTAGQYMGRARAMAREFQRTMEQAADESGLGESARHLKALNRLDLNAATGKARKYAADMVRDTKAAVEAPLPDAAAPTPPDAAAPTLASAAAAPMPAAAAPAAEPDGSARGAPGQLP